jgi:hypothetical protein
MVDRAGHESHIPFADWLFGTSDLDRGASVKERPQTPAPFFLVGVEVTFERDSAVSDSTALGIFPQRVRQRAALSLEPFNMAE